jgi:hypothetical protein
VILEASVLDLDPDRTVAPGACPPFRVRVTVLVQGPADEVAVFFRRPGGQQIGTQELSEDLFDWAGEWELAAGEYDFTVAAVGPGGAASSDAGRVRFACGQ